jgi:hypothetical protein
MKPAAGRQRRGEEALVPADQREQELAGKLHHPAEGEVGHPTPTTARRQDRRSRCSASNGAA